MALGATLAGIKVKIAIESDDYAALTYQHNHPETQVLAKNICEIKQKEITTENVKQKMILFGGPPCQGFSTSNQKTRSEANPLNWLFVEYMRIVKLVKPDWVVFENVKGILETAKGIFFNMVLSELHSCGYTTSHWVLNAADYGVPQNRNRLFVVGSLDGKRVNRPDPTVSKHVTVKQAISDLPDLENGALICFVPHKHKPKTKYACLMCSGLGGSSNHLITKNSSKVIERYKHIPQGGNWVNIPKKLMKNYTDTSRCHTGIYHRLKEDSPSVVIGNFRKNMLIHPRQDRGLSVREAARLQSFPDSYEFKGSIGFQQQQVGNAVPPLLAKEVFESIIKL